jgi:syncollin
VRRRRFPAWLALAGYNSTVEDTMLKFPPASGALTAAGLILGLIGLDVRPAQAQAEACTAYEHANFGGRARTLPGNGSVRSSALSDKISSFKMIRGCHVEAFENANFKGASARWDRNISFVGSNWNDIISSWKCVCGVPLD